MRIRLRWTGVFLGSLMVLVVGCGAATRATVHQDDFKKVFPWPTTEKKLTIQVKPKTTLNNTCFFFGSFEPAEVSPDTTFYITDESDQQFAYTPNRSPIRRLAPVKSMEIRWPPKDKDAAAQEAPGETPGEAKPEPEQKPEEKKPPEDGAGPPE